MDRGLLNKEALKINARGNLRGLTLTKYKISSRWHRTPVPLLITVSMSFMDCLILSANQYWLMNLPMYGLMRSLSNQPLQWWKAFATWFPLQYWKKRKVNLPPSYLDNLQNNTSLAYGVGYRKMKSNLAQKNWPTLLAEMKHKSKPPKLK